MSRQTRFTFKTLCIDTPRKLEKLYPRQIRSGKEFAEAMGQFIYNKLKNCYRGVIFVPILVYDELVRLSRA
jgi:hypothetical protein